MKNKLLPTLTAFIILNVSITFAQSPAAPTSAPRDTQDYSSMDRLKAERNDIKRKIQEGLAYIRAREQELMQKMQDVKRQIQEARDKAKRSRQESQRLIEQNRQSQKDQARMNKDRMQMLQRK